MEGPPPAGSQKNLICENLRNLWIKNIPAVRLVRRHFAGKRNSISTDTSSSLAILPLFNRRISR